MPEISAPGRARRSLSLKPLWSRPEGAEGPYLMHWGILPGWMREIAAFQNGIPIDS